MEALVNIHGQESNTRIVKFQYKFFLIIENVSVLGLDAGYTIKYTPPPEGVPEGYI